MARVALVMDKLMTSLGLSGKAFLPLMTSFGCAVPGMMATRTMESTRDRMVTLLVAPLMSCSARLPVYTLMITTFVPTTSYLNGWVTLHGLLFLMMYALGAIVAIPIAWLLKRLSSLARQPPSYWSCPNTNGLRLELSFNASGNRFTRSSHRAGSLILCTSILVWAAAYFPGDHSRENELARKIEDLPSIGSEEQTITREQWVTEANSERSRLIATSYLGRFGRTLEPAFHAVGWIGR